MATVFDEIVRLHNLKRQPLPDSDEMRDLVSTVEKADIPLKFISESVDEIGNSPNRFWNLGELVTLARGKRRRAEEASDSRPPVKDPISEMVGEKFGGVHAELVSRKSMDEAPGHVWELLQGLADEMIDFYQGMDDRTPENNEALAEWRVTKAQAEARLKGGHNVT